MLDLFDAWAKAYRVTPEFIIRKPLRNLAEQLELRNWQYHSLYYTNWAQRHPPKEPLEIEWLAKRNIKAIADIEKIIATSKPDVVMTNTTVSPWAAIAANHAGVPHVWFVREYGDTDSGFEFTLGKPKTFETIGQLSALVVANSQTLARHTGQFTKAPITTLYTPFDLAALESSGQEKVANPFTNPDSLKLVIVGRIAPSKGQATVVNAASILIQQGIPVELCIVGEPSDAGDRVSLDAVIAKNRLADDVHFVGRQSNPLPFVALADIGIMASRNEAFGRTTFEYLALGKPVVGADSGATPEMVTTGENGFLYTLDDPSSLAAALSHYAQNKTLLALHGKAARRKAEAMMASEFSAPALYEKIKHIRVAQPPEHYAADWLDHPKSVQHTSTSITRKLTITFKHFLKSAYIRFS